MEWFPFIIIKYKIRKLRIRIKNYIIWNIRIQSRITRKFNINSTYNTDRSSNKLYIFWCIDLNSFYILTKTIIWRKSKSPSSITITTSSTSSIFKIPIQRILMICSVLSQARIRPVKSSRKKTEPGRWSWSPVPCQLPIPLSWKALKRPS